jgi:hypothetical protein
MSKRYAKSELLGRMGADRVSQYFTVTYMLMEMQQKSQGGMGRKPDQED